MIDIRADSNAPAFLAAMKADAAKVPKANARALTWVAFDARKAEVEEMTRVFDRATPYTLGSLYVSPASAQSQAARVWFKDTKAVDHYLLPQVKGGDRALKRFEYRLHKVGLMDANEIAVPGEGAQLDSYGNISRGQLSKILSQLKTAIVSGDYSNASDSKRSKAKRAKETYFVSRGRGSWQGKVSWKNGRSQHLHRGVWMRRTFGNWGSAVKPVLMFVPKPVHYSTLFAFEEIGRKVVVEKYPGAFDRAMKEAGLAAVVK